MYRRLTMKRKQPRRSTGIIVRDLDGRFAERNPDWDAIRARAGEYGAKAREHAQAAYEWTKPRAKAAAERSAQAARDAYEWSKPRAKAAAERAAKAAREGYEYAAPRVRSAAESAGRSIKRGSKHAAGYVGGHLSAYSARENGRLSLRNSNASQFILIPSSMYDGVHFPIGTNAEIKRAKAAMRRAGIGTVSVYVGDPYGDHHRNGQVLHGKAKPAAKSRRKDR